MSKYINQIVLIQAYKDDGIPYIGEKGQIVAIIEDRNACTDDGTVIPIPYDVVFNSNFSDKRFYAEEETVLTGEE